MSIPWWWGCSTNWSCVVPWLCCFVFTLCSCTPQAEQHTFLNADSPHMQLCHCVGDGKGRGAEQWRQWEVWNLCWKCLRNVVWGEFAGVICFFPFPSLFKWRLIEIICLVRLWQYSVYQTTFCQTLGLATAGALSWYSVYNHYFIIKYYSVQVLISHALLLLCHFLLPVKGWKKNLAEWKKT